jgi:hypothetical protein
MTILFSNTGAYNDSTLVYHLFSSFVMTQTISSQTPSFQTVIEMVEALSIEEQDLLFSLVQKHRIVDRRQAILQRSIEAQTAFEAGTAKVGTAEEAIADLFGDEECER